MGGGHLSATNATFAWDTISLNNGSVLYAGDMTGDTFQTIVSVPGIDIPLLAGPEPHGQPELPGRGYHRRQPQ